MKYYLYLFHRWLGIVLCLFMAMWFISGVVMLYVGYPKLSHAERLKALPMLESERCCAELSRVIAATQVPENIESLRLTSVNHTPRFIIQYPKMHYVAVDGLSGEQIRDISAETSVEAANAFRIGTGIYSGSVTEDPWTHSRALDGLRPLHKVHMSDAEETLLYVSSVTGEVVRDATATERIWNWVGAWIHWLYPFRGGIFDVYASDIIIYTSLAGCILSITGLATGILRWRFQGHYKQGSKTPYRNIYMRWHHISGLLFGVITFTWILSGMLSMNPWKIFDSDKSLFNMQAYTRAHVDNAYFPLSAKDALKNFQSHGFYPCELEWRVFDGAGYYLGFDQTGVSQILLAQPNAEPVGMLPLEQLQRAGERAMGQAKLSRIEVLTQYDAYYYARAPHTMTGHTEKRLPMLRLEFDDPHQTWLHIDPYTGSVMKLDSYHRTSRWLFAFLHSWDWLPLLNRRPVWDMLLIFLSIGGIVISASGIVIAWKRLHFKLSH